MRTNEDYRSILSLPYPYSSVRRRMTLHDRAAQFSAFDALKGYGDEVEETIRLTDEQRIVDEDERMRVNALLEVLRDGETHSVMLTYFIPDERKTGGRYRTVCGEVKKQDTGQKTLLLADGTVVPMEQIVLLELQEEWI